MYCLLVFYDVEIHSSILILKTILMPFISKNIENITYLLLMKM